MLRIAGELASGGGNLRGRPRQSDLKTAVNRTYYALFHALAIIAADAATGKRARSRKDPAWAHTARALNHQTAKQQCQRIVGQGLLSAGARRFAQTFTRMQGLRHEADYYDYSRYTRTQVQTWVAQAEQAMKTLKGEPEKVQRSLAAMVMHRHRVN